MQVHIVLDNVLGLWPKCSTVVATGIGSSPSDHPGAVESRSQYNRIRIQTISGRMLFGTMGKHAWKTRHELSSRMSLSFHLRGVSKGVVQRKFLKVRTAGIFAGRLRSKVYADGILGFQGYLKAP